MTDPPVRLDHASLAVTDLDAAIGFFSEGLGLTLAFQERGMTDQIASMLGRPGATCDLAQLVIPGTEARLEVIAFHGHPAPGEPAPITPGQGHTAFRVAGFDVVVARLERLGATRLGAVTEFSDGRSVYLITPVGAVIEIEEDRGVTR